MRGIEATSKVKSLYPNTAILILTMHKSIEYLSHSISAGASGYLLKEDSDVELLSAINAIRKGEIYVSKLMSKEFEIEITDLKRGMFQYRTELLSARENEVLKLIAEGNSNKKIADLLFISPRTVETHRANIMKKLCLKNSAELIKYAIITGIIT